MFFRKQIYVHKLVCSTMNVVRIAYLHVFKHKEKINHTFQHTLLATIGISPQIVTENLYAIHRENKQ